MDIQIGSEVQLKSGGPIMTVREILIDGKTVICDWFSKEELKSSNFVLETLELYESGF